ncbi:HD-GYP domain-containing protein [Geosporobacter ferrireducens]|uniref:HD-GYP domain-containing protein n=1 Tax=Geosporobacter ferrireducens TaxID=1424294 RepID=UPI0009F6325A|nr:HD domain-containing phosphohydrolase [Geosporobacter ferrireducens]
MGELSLKLRIYTSLIISSGLFTVYLGIKHLSLLLIPEIIFFSILGAVAESLIIKLRKNIGISVNFAIGLAVVLIFRSPVASIIGFLSMLLWVDYIDGKLVHIFNSSIYKRLFNGSAYAISLAIAVFVYKFVDAKYGFLSLMGLNSIALIVSVCIYICINISIFSILMSFLFNMHFKQALKENSWLGVNILGLSPLGTVIAIAYQSYGWFSVVLFFGPLLIARYSFKLYMDMRHVYFETIKALSNAMEAKDEYTTGHSYRVADYAVGIAEQMGLKPDRVEQIRTAAILHDIGKIGISDSILNKCGQLESNEYLEIQKHPEIGAKILAGVDFLAEVADIIKHHHERYDGKGYPDKLEGPQISIESCILAVADAYDAMTSDRPYRRAMNQQTAVNIILEQAGKQFNPVVVKSFIDYFNMQPKERIAHVS